MQGWRDIPLPEALTQRPKDDRGFPITFVTLIQEDGTPDFTTIDARQILRCIVEKSCGMCGVALPVASVETLPTGLGHDVRTRSYGAVAFIGGPLAIENKNFLDPPMHVSCAEYAMRVCPHIAIPTARYAKPKEGEGRRVFELVEPTRPERFGMYVTSHYQVVPYQGQPVFLAEPADRVVWADELPDLNDKERP